MVKLTLGRSGAMYEEPNPLPADVEDIVTLGPFEYVEITYDLLRTSPDGEFIGAFKDGVWFLNDDPHPFSDLDIYSV